MTTENFEVSLNSQALSRSEGKLFSWNENAFAYDSNVKEFRHLYPVEYLYTHEGTFNSLLGTNVRFSNLFAVSGASGADYFQGAVYIYKPISEYDWHPIKIISPPPEATDAHLAKTVVNSQLNFGISVDIDEDTNAIIIGANAYEYFTGRAFIYSYHLNESSGNYSWSLNATLVSPKGHGHGFGLSVGISGDNAIVGSNSNGAFMHSYDSQTNSWKYVTTLESPELSLDSHFGYSVAISGDKAVVGAYTFGKSFGRVYIYENIVPFNATYRRWVLTNKILSVTGYNSFFGISVDIYRSHVIVGACGYRPGIYGSIGIENSNSTGAAYIFDLLADGNYSLNSTLKSVTGQDGYFGYSVGIHEHNAIVGAYGYGNGSEIGAAFIYTKENISNEWSNNLDSLSLSPSLIENRQMLSSWQLKYSTVSLAGSQSFWGWGVGIGANNFGIGAFGFADMNGALILGAIGIVPPSPSYAPTENPISILACTGKSCPSSTTWPLNPWIIAVSAAFLVGFALCSLCCCCCYYYFYILALDNSSDGASDSTPSSPYNIRLSFEKRAILGSDPDEATMEQVVEPWPPARPSSSNCRISRNEYPNSNAGGPDGGSPNMSGRTDCQCILVGNTIRAALPGLIETASPGDVRSLLRIPTATSTLFPAPACLPSFPNAIPTTRGLVPNTLSLQYGPYPDFPFPLGPYPSYSSLQSPTATSPFHATAFSPCALEKGEGSPTVHHIHSLRGNQSTAFPSTENESPSIRRARKIVAHIQNLQRISTESTPQTAAIPPHPIPIATSPLEQDESPIMQRVRREVAHINRLRQISVEISPQITVETIRPIPIETSALETEQLSIIQRLRMGAADIQAFRRIQAAKDEGDDPGIESLM